MKSDRVHGVAVRAPDVVADSIRAGIVSGRFTTGRPLGCEEQLKAEHNVSRATLREALRVLESEGFVRVRRGPGGGAFAQLPSRSRVGSSLVPHLLLAGADAGEVGAVRELLGSLQGLPGYQGNPALTLLAELVAQAAAAMPAARPRVRAA